MDQKALKILHEHIFADTNNEVVVDLAEWIHDRVRSNPRVAAAAMVTALASIIAQTSSCVDQAEAVAGVYATYLMQISKDMKHLEEHMESN